MSDLFESLNEKALRATEEYNKLGSTFVPLKFTGEPFILQGFSEREPSNLQLRESKLPKIWKYIDTVGIPLICTYPQMKHYVDSMYYHFSSKYKAYKFTFLLDEDVALGQHKNCNFYLKFTASFVEELEK